MSVHESSNVRRMASSAEAFWTAEAGINKSTYELNHGCANFKQQGTNIACASCSSCGAGNKVLAFSIAGSCDYDATINNANTSVTVVGSCPSRSAPQPVQRSVQVAIGTASPFTYAAFGKVSVSLSNNTFVDSYDSSAGVYSNGNSDTNGSVGTNGTAVGSIVINNNATVGGNVSTGVGGTVTLGGGALVTGTTTHTNNVSIPDVSVPAALTGLASSGTLTLNNNQSQNIAAGDYKYTNIDMKNNTTLNIMGGPVRLYLTGAAALAAANNVAINIVNGASLQIYVDGVFTVNNNVALNVAGNLPKNLQVYSTYSGANGIAINNNSDIFGAIYAPQTDIAIGNNGDIYGSIIGKTITASNNAAVHYDETLQSLANTSGATGVTSWKEI